MCLADYLPDSTDCGGLGGSIILNGPCKDFTNADEVIKCIDKNNYTLGEA